MSPDLEDFEKRLHQARHAKDPTPEEMERIKQAQDNRAGLNAGVEFVVSIVVSSTIGYGLDQWLNTQPLFLIVLFLLGVTAGFVNIYKASMNLGSSVGYSELHQREKQANTSPEKEVHEQNEVE